MKKQNHRHGFHRILQDQGRISTVRFPLFAWILAAVIAVPMLGPNMAMGQSDWPMDDWLQKLKLNGYELIATVQGKDVPIRSGEAFKRLPDDPPPKFKLLNVATGKEIPIAAEGGKQEGWGRWIWTKVCDAAGLKPNCNGFFK